MTGNKVFLDTNIVIEVFAGNREIADKIKGLDGFFISAIVLGELYVGVNRVTNKPKHLHKLIEFLDLCDVISIDSNTSQYFGEITASLFKKGKPIPANDIWIAATVRQYGLTLISQDRHFKSIDNIKLEVW